MSKTNIEWTTDSWNPVVGCTKVSPGCRECYAEKMAVRLRAMALAAGRDPGRKRAYIDAVDDRGRWTGKLIPVPEALADPLGWRKPRRVFVNSMSDLFHESVPDAFIDRVFGAMAKAFWHTYQVLTKRADRMAAYLNAPGVNARILEQARQFDWPGWAMRAVTRDGSGYPGWPIKNVWLGVSVEDQQRADERIPILLQIPAAVRFLSCEPLLGPVQLGVGGCMFDYGVGGGGRSAGIDWVIVGGESGANARPCNVEWIRGIVAQCREVGVPVFVKQLGSKPLILERELHDLRGGSGDGDLQEWVPGDGLVAMKTRDGKGGKQYEWPDDVQVRQYPGTSHV